jgi:hypothetical protein
MGVPAVTGLRYALEPGDGTTSSPSRSVIAGAAIAIAALVGALVFGASLDTLVHRPALYGWNWDAAVLAGSGYANIPLDRAHTVLDADPNISAWSGAHFGFDTVDGHEVPLLGVETDSEVLPPIVQGRSIANDREVVLGAATADELGKHLGDPVTFAGDRTGWRATVVGIATFPTIGMLHAAHTSLGVGALVSTDRVPGRDRDITGQKATGLGPSVIFLRLRPGVDGQAEIDRLRTTTRPLSGFAGLDVLRVQRPAEIVNSSSIGAAPVLLASSLVIAAMISLGLALAASVRRRRRDLTVLKALGCTPRELGATVSWHATTTVVLGLVIGVPLGALLGHALWDRFATELDAVARTDVPWLAIAAVAVGAIVIGNVVAALPARVARRVDPSRLLTTE